MEKELIYIFMCSWKRLHNLDKLLINLNDQTCASKIVMNIWNNNIDNSEELHKIINKHTNLQYRINLKHSDKNLYAFGRFIYMTEFNIEYAIIIDDDQLFSNDYFEKLWNMKKKNTFITWYGSILNGRNYWDRTIIDMNNIVKNEKKYITEYEYGGPGGSLIDASIVKNKEFINIPTNYLVADDIWLSYIVKKIGWTIERSFLPPILLITEKDESEAMYLTVGKNKHSLYAQLLNKGWIVKKEACIITLGIGKRYERGVDRLESLVYSLKVGADFYGYKKYPDGIPTHEEIPYGFKYFLIKQKLDEGYKRVLWLDSSVLITDNLDWLWEKDIMIINNTHDLGRYSSDKCLEYFKMNRKTAYNIISILGGLIMFEKKYYYLINKMCELAKSKITFEGSHSNINNEVSTNSKVKGHRHDQSVLTILIQNTDIEPLPNSTILNYDSHERCDYTKYINKYKFIVDRNYVYDNTLNDILVSVIIPTFNRYEFLMVAIDSVKKQTHKNIEIIVINDKSTDEQYNNILDDKLILINLETNSKSVVGKPCAGYVRNFGLKIARGEYIAFLDDDDYWFPEKIETQLKAMIKNNTMMACSDGYKGIGMYNKSKFNEYKLYSDCDKQYDAKEMEFADYPSIINRKMIKKRNIIYCSSVIIHKSIKEKVGLMDHVRNGKEDHGYWLRCLEHTDCYRCKEPLFFYSLRQ